MKLSIHEMADRDSIRAAGEIPNEKLARAERLAAYGRAVAKYAQEVDTRQRRAWPSRASDETPADDAHPLIVQLRGWLKDGRKTERRTRYREGSDFIGGLRRDSGTVTETVTINQEWISRLFIDDEHEPDTAAPAKSDIANDGGNEVVIGSSGTAFDHQAVFAFEDAARALVFHQTGRYPPLRTDSGSPLFAAYSDWLNVIRECYASGAIAIAVYEDDNRRTPHIRRQDLANWCQSRGLRPAFLFPSASIAASAAAEDVAPPPVSAEDPPDTWARGLKRVAWEVARKIVADTGSLTGPALWGEISIRDDVAVSGSRATYKRAASGYAKSGEESANAKTVKGAWRQALAALLMPKG